MIRQTMYIYYSKYSIYIFGCNGCAVLRLYLPKHCSMGAADGSTDLATTMADKTSPNVAAPIQPDRHQPKKSKAQIWLVLVSMLLAMFLVSIDRTIISTV